MLVKKFDTTDARSQFSTKVQNLFHDDIGEWTPHDLKANQSANLAKTWSNSNLIGGVMKMYSTCDAKGSSLVNAPASSEKASEGPKAIK